MVKGGRSKMIESIFNTLLQLAQAFINFLAGMFTALQDLIWTAGTGGTGGELTFFGVLILISASAGLVMWAIGLIRSLISFRRD